MFFRLTHPPYEDDFQNEKLNPVWIESPYNIPGIVCPVCGPMGFSARLRIPLPSQDVLDEFRDMRHLPLNQWLAERSRWAEMLNLCADQLTPGASLGPPCGLLKGMPTSDVIHPSGELWVRTHVMNKLKEISCTGVEYAKASFVYRPGDIEAFCEGVVVDYEQVDEASLPEYWEVTVTGTAWREGQSEETVRVCHLCGRTEFPSPHRLRVDESRWDGSDFFNVDRNTRIVFVTDRVCKALEKLGASNYHCKPL
jgi:hypothetical protein